MIPINAATTSACCVRAIAVSHQWIIRVNVIRDVPSMAIVTDARLDTTLITMEDAPVCNNLPH